MAAQGRVYHNPYMPGQAGSWREWGENVGGGGSVDDIHNAFMNSSEHRANILGPAYNLIGIGVASWSGGVMVVEDFVARDGVAGQYVAPRVVAAPPPPPPSPPAPPAVVEPEPIEAIHLLEIFIGGEVAYCYVGPVSLSCRT
jgi:hypothetical protein